MIHALLRRRLLERAGVDRPAPVRLADIIAAQSCPEFEQLRQNRMVMGYFRYGDLHRQRPGQYDNVASIRRRLERYEADGNLEHLVDIANIAMVEFVTSDHPKRHFHAVDDGEHTRRK